MANRDVDHYPHFVKRICEYLRETLKAFPTIKSKHDRSLAEEGVSEHEQFDDTSNNHLAVFIQGIAEDLPEPNKLGFLYALGEKCGKLYGDYKLLERSEAIDTMITRLRDAVPTTTTGESRTMRSPFESALARVGDLVHALVCCRNRNLFVRELIHPGVTSEHVERLMQSVIELATDVPQAAPVVFFDEVNTSSILGLFKEMLIDRTINGRPLPPNIFFVAAVNPKIKTTEKQDLLDVGAFNVHDLPASMALLKWNYNPLEGRMLEEYIGGKLRMTFRENLPDDKRGLLTGLLLSAHQFYLDLLHQQKLATNAVSQRDIQRIFKVLEHFYGDLSLATADGQQDNTFLNAVCMAIACVYYFRLPEESSHGPTRTTFSVRLSRLLPPLSSLSFAQIVSRSLAQIISPTNFSIPAGVALNQALQENMLCILVTVCTSVPSCIVGRPGTSKTLSMQLIAQNMRGEMSPLPYCRKLPSVDPFFCQVFTFLKIIN